MAPEAEMLDAIILLVYLFAVYLVAPVVAGASLVRLIFGWHNSRKDAVLAFLFALPQCIVLHFGVNSTFWIFTKGTVLYVTLGKSEQQDFWGADVFERRPNE